MQSKKTILGSRLSTIAALAYECQTFADIGSDHAFLPIWLLENNKAKQAIITEARLGPLQNGIANAVKAGVAGRCSFRIGNGLEPLSAGEASCVSITGMGGRTIMGILQKNEQKSKSFPKLILGPQTYVDELRLFLSQHGYFIDENAIAKEHGHFYQIMLIDNAKAAPYCPDKASIIFPEKCRNAEIYEEYLLSRLQKAQKELALMRGALAKRTHQEALKMSEIEMIQFRINALGSNH
ncbi:MAG: class I SAM-dependent methyltransferase [Eubacteriaceae bacterium]|nr:class I SAM-dependent methyltransferase [Eubacteriaceae bacterium]